MPGGFSRRDDAEAMGWSFKRGMVDLITFLFCWIIFSLIYWYDICTIKVCMESKLTLILFLLHVTGLFVNDSSVHICSKCFIQFCEQTVACDCFDCVDQTFFKFGFKHWARCE